MNKSEIAQEKKRLKEKERYSFEDLKSIMAVLLSEEGCPWDRAQTHESLIPHLEEESGEVIAAVRNGDMENLCEELGDLLFQVMIHSRLAEESGAFTVDDVVNGVSAKMVRRHPNVFGDERVGSSVLDRHITIVTRNDSRLRLNLSQDSLYTNKLVCRHLIRLVQQNDITELHLLYDKARQVIFSKITLRQIRSFSKLISQSESITHRNNSVKFCYAVLCIFRIHLRINAYCLRYRCGFTYSARLNHDIIETVLRNNLTQLLNEVHFKSTTDAAVLQSDKTIIALSDHSTLLYQVGINVHFADIINDNGKPNTFLI